MYMNVDNQNKLSQIKVHFTKNMIPKGLFTKVKAVFFILGVMQGTFYYIILVSLNDLGRIFQSKSQVIISLG